MSWRRTRDYRVWRAQVIRRDKVCVLCFSAKSRNAHHIADGSYHPELRFDVDNGVTLCRKCHTQFHTNFKNSFREKCTLKDWKNFKCLTEYIGELTNVWK